MNLKTSAILLLLGSVSFVLLADVQPDGTRGATDTDTTDSNLATDSIALPDFTELDELVVVERKKLVESDGAKLTYNVTEDPEAGGSNILDILRKVPGVTVDAEENVKVNGQSSFKILMNGREDPMLKGDIKTALKSLPAATIKKIEVISEPGAKYEAEGVGGVLNIVTDRKQSLTGYMTQLGAWVNAYQAGGYLTAKAKFNKVMLDATVSYNNGRGWPRKAISDTRYDYLSGSDAKYQDSRTESKGGWDYTGANLNMSWEPDTLNLFTLTGYYGYNSWGNESKERREMFAEDDSMLWSLQRDFDTHGSYNGFGTQLSYQHNFRRDDNNLILSYEMDYGPMKNRSNVFVKDIAGTLNDSPYSSNRSKTNTYNHIFQLDYMNRFSPKHLLETGAKAYINRAGKLSQAYMGQSEEEAVLIDNLTVDLDQIKDVYSLYGSYTGTFSKWNVKAGLRYEMTKMGLQYTIGDYTDFHTYLHDVVPNGAISYNLSAASSLRLAYQMRISRPNISKVDPYVNVLTPGQINYGNPDLKSEKGHTITLGYSNYEGKFTGSAKLGYRFVNNGVSDIIFMRDGIMHSTYANVGTEHCGSLDLSGDWNISQAFRWSVYASGSYTYMKADSELLKAKNSGWQCYLNTNLNYTLPSKIRISGYGGMWTPWIDLQGKGTTTGYYYGVGASKSWLKDDALTINMSVSNLFPTSRRNSYTQTQESVALSRVTSYQQWNVGINISFKFGGLQASVKKTSANIEKESSNSGNGSGEGSGK